MDSYLLALGWWNLIGCSVMFGFFNESFGRKMLNDWTKIFAIDYSVNYWSRFWLSWAIGLNVYFALVNILSVKWGYAELKIFAAGFDIAAYIIFLFLCFIGMRSGRTGSGIYSAILIFLVWIIWGIYALMQ